jgi:hypothetical protein
MSGDKRISGWVNPLAFLEVDEPWASATKGTPDVNAVLRFLCPANEELNLTTILARYKEMGLLRIEWVISHGFRSAQACK